MGYNIGMVQKVLPSKDSRLRSVSKKVTKIDKKVLSLISDLEDTLSVQKDPEGVGLAAHQIGKNLRIFVVNHKTFKKVFINPEVIEIKNDKNIKKPKSHDILEGCLSLPNYYGPVDRPNFVKIKYMDKNGMEVEEEFKNLSAQIVLHEIDHLNGVLFIDKLFEQKKPLYKFEGKEWEEIQLI